MTWCGKICFKMNSRVVLWQNIFENKTYFLLKVNGKKRYFPVNNFCRINVKQVRLGC